METVLQSTERQPLPHRLLIQMDNCVRENKNKYVMAFFAILVELGIFTEVCIDIDVCVYVHVIYVCHYEFMILD